MEKSKPKFRRQGQHRKARIKKKGWRRPRGIDSKQKIEKKYMPRLPTVGYGRAKSVRNLHPCGLQEVLISNVNELHNLDAKTQVIRISSRVGNKKKITIVKEAEAKKFKILNKNTFKKKPKEKKKVEKKEEPKKEEVKPAVKEEKITEKKVEEKPKEVKSAEAKPEEKKEEHKK